MCDPGEIEDDELIDGPDVGDLFADNYDEVEVSDPFEEDNF